MKELRPRPQVDEPLRVAPEYKYKNGDLVLIPYHPDAGIYKEDALVRLYVKLKAEELFEVVFHDNPNLSLAGFIALFTNPSTLLQIVGHTDGAEINDIVGMAWLADVCQASGMLTKGIGAFVVFKRYQRPFYTDRCADLVTDFWFNTLGVDIVVGMSPVLNRAALRFLRRIGFRECGRIPNYTSLRGQICDAVIAYMSR